MTTQILRLNKAGLNFITTVFKSDPVFSISFLLALASCIFTYPKLSSINFDVLICLFNLMVVIKAFEELRLLDRFAVAIINRCTDSRKVSLIMILLSFFSSMVVTNDISLLTLVPLTLIISRKTGMDVVVTVVLQTLAANIGSSLTPLGNPQNLYIFSYYKLTAFQFFPPIILFAGMGLVWLYLLNLRCPRFSLDIEMESVKSDGGIRTGIWIFLFGVVILSVFKVVSFFTVLLLILVATIAINRELLLKVDYLLLATFICFFIFIGNISGIPEVRNVIKSYLDSRASTYFCSILLSQLISNVPCTILLSKFTSSWRELLLGVNIGGMGTIIASLASVISYKLFINENLDNSKDYIVKFNVYNFVSLIVFAAVNYLVVVR